MTIHQATSAGDGGWTLGMPPTNSCSYCGWPHSCNENLCASGAPDVPDHEIDQPPRRNVNAERATATNSGGTE